MYNFNTKGGGRRKQFQFQVLQLKRGKGGAFGCATGPHPFGCPFVTSPPVRRQAAVQPGQYHLSIKSACSLPAEDQGPPSALHSVRV